MNISSLSLFLLLFLTPLQPAQDAENSYRQKNRSFHTLEEFEKITGKQVPIIRGTYHLTPSGNIYVGSSRGAVRMIRGVPEPFPPDHMLPWNEVTVIAEQHPGVVWIGTTRGAIRYEEEDRQRPVQYFASKRWLPDDRVTGIAFQGQGRQASVWVETEGGFSLIGFQSMTLEQKAAIFQDRVRARHVRHGFTSSSHLRVAGDLSSNQPVSNDNDGLWTAMYLAGECYRYKVTGSDEARANARQGIRALMRLEAISGIPGFPARSFIEIGAEAQPADGEWHATPDGRWKWKADTSSDEIVGHYYAYAIYYDLVADEAEKREIRTVVDRITSHIVDKGYQLIDVDGKHTRWGWWAPEQIWEDPDETGLRALHLLSHLRVAYHITGKQKYKREYDTLIAKHRYALLTRNQKINYPGSVNHSDDELAFLSYYPLLRYETDPRLRAIYIESLERNWQVERPERNPLWNYIYAVGSGSKEYDAAESLETLKQIPMDLVTWTVVNSHRLDIPLDPANDRHRRKQALIVLPPDERPMMKWNGNPYSVDGGNDGRSEDDGAFFLLPYWMGRYYKLIP